MSNKEKPLPKPPTRAFGARVPEEQTLLSDRMAAAIAEGRLDEFLKEELPDNEQARSLAMMMLGMTGMLPQGTGPQPPPVKEQEDTSAQAVGETARDVLQAVQGGDVKGLMDLLRREHQKRSGGAGAETGLPQEVPAPHPAGQPVIDKEVLDALIDIASKNSVSLDWVILRAIKVYVEEYRKTGKL